MNTALLFLVLAATPAQKAEYTDQVQQVFSVAPVDERYIGVIGPWTTAVEQKEDGLHIQFPDGNAKPNEVGVNSKQHIHGDFELTVTYQLLAPTPPKSGYGAGVMMWVMINDGQGTFAAIARRTKPGGGESISTSRGYYPDGKLSQVPKFAKAGGREGRLRLVREGSTIKYFKQEPGDDAFELIREEANFGTAPVKHNKIVADRGSSKDPLQVMLKDVTIRADKLSPTMKVENTNTGSEPKEVLPPLEDVKTSVNSESAPRSYTTLFIVLGIGVVLTVLFLLGWMWFSRGEDDEDEDEYEDEDED